MILALDAKLFFFLNKACANPVFDFLMPLITWLGDGDFVLALAVLMVLIAFVTRKIRKMPGILLLAGLAISHFVVYYFKQFFSRPRPFVTLENVRVLVAGLDKNHSFPSGHASFFFAASFFLLFYSTRFALIFVFSSCLVGLARVFCGVHWFHDIVGGFASGLVSSGIIYYLLNFLIK